MIQLVKGGKRSLLLSFVMIILVISISITTFAAFSSTATVTGTITFVDPGLVIATKGSGDAYLIDFSTESNGSPVTDFGFISGFSSGFTDGSDMSTSVEETVGGTSASNSNPVITNQLNGEYIEYEFSNSPGTDVKYSISATNGATNVYAGFEFDLLFPNTINYHYVYPAINTSFSTQTLSTITLLNDNSMVDYVYQTPVNYKSIEGVSAVLMCVNIEAVTIEEVSYTKKTYRVYFVNNNATTTIGITSTATDFYLSDFVTGIRCIIGVGNPGQYLPFGGTNTGINATRTVKTTDVITLNSKCSIGIANAFGNLPQTADYPPTP